MKKKIQLLTCDCGAEVLAECWHFHMEYCGGLIVGFKTTEIYVPKNENNIEGQDDDEFI